MIKKSTDDIKLARMLTPLTEETRKKLQAISRQYNLVLKHVFGSGIDQALVRALDQQREMAQRIADSLQPAIKIWQNWIDENQSIFQRIVKVWEDDSKQYKIAEKKAANILRKYKWLICPSMPAAATGVILKVAQKKGRKDRDINRLFIDYFARNNWNNAASIVDGWSKNPLFVKRMPIFRNCIYFLQHADRNKVNGAVVVLPALISQIDGILTDYLRRHNIMNVKTYTEKKNKFQATKPTAMTSEFNELAKDIFLNILFQKTYLGQPLMTPFNFNRHKIMHGESVKFGRKDYVVRAIMVLDFLAHLE